MSDRLRAWALCLATTGGASAAQLMTATPAFAQQSAEPQARAAFEQGVEALRSGRFRDAAAALERSYSLRAVPVVLYNLALAYRGAGQRAPAIETFERFLADPGGEFEPARLRAIREEVQALRAVVVTLDLDVEPPNAALQVDGSPVAARHHRALIEPGRRVIELSATGFRPDRREALLEPGATVTVRARLESLGQSGWLEVRPSVPNAAVFIDGERAGLGTIARPVAEGAHTVLVRADGHELYTREVRIVRGGQVRLDASMPPTRQRWVAPVLVGVGVLVVAGVVAGVVMSSGSSSPYTPSLGNSMEMDR